MKRSQRDTFYDHKVCLTGGSSNLILDCLVLEGNPADYELSGEMLDRQKVTVVILLKLLWMEGLPL